MTNIKLPAYNYFSFLLLLILHPPDILEVDAEATFKQEGADSGGILLLIGLNYLNDVVNNL